MRRKSQMGLQALMSLLLCASTSYMRPSGTFFCTNVACRHDGHGAGVAQVTKVCEDIWMHLMRLMQIWRDTLVRSIATAMLGLDDLTPT